MLGIAVIFRAWLYLIGSFQKSNKIKMSSHSHASVCKSGKLQRQQSRVWRRFIPVLLGLGTRTSAMAVMMVLFPLRLLTRSIILSVISLMGLRSRRWSSVD